MTVTQPVHLSVERSLKKLPRLGQINPKAARLIERIIDDWMVPDPDEGNAETDGEHAEIDGPTLITRYAALSADHQRLVDQLVRELGKLP
jgi:hypothetical protein